MAGDFDIENFLDNVDVPASKVIIEPGVEHVPVILLLDTSSSMNFDRGFGLPIDELNNCLQEFFSDIINEKTDNDRKMRLSADFCIIEYNSSVNVVMPWTHGSQITMSDIPKLSASGSTAMYEAIIEASDQLLRQFAAYKQKDVDTFCANIFNITDGGPNENAEAFKRAQKAVRLFATAGRQENPYGIFYHVGVKGYDRKPLLELAASEDHVIDLENRDISDVFQFIRASLNPDQLKLLGA